MIKILFFLIAVFIFFLHPFDGNGDFYHHISTGKWILQNWQLPQVDSFTHTRTGQPWVAHSWASGILFYLIFQSFGGVVISIFVSLIAVLSFFLLYKLLKLQGISENANLITLALTAAAVSTRYFQRPEILAYPLLLSLFLVNHLRTNKSNLSILLPLIILAWANFYGSGEIMGLGILGLFCLEQLVKDGFKIKQSQYIFYFSLILSLAASYTNGYGFKTLFYLFLYIPQVKVYEGEWAGIFDILKSFPISYIFSIQSYILIYFIYIFSLITLIFFSAKQIIAKKFELWPKFLFATFMIFPIFAFRQFPTAAFLAAPFLAVLIQYQFQKRRHLLVGLILFISIVLLALSGLNNHPGLSNKSDLALNQMVSYINDHHITGKAFNHTHFGGFLTFTFYPNILTFIDTRDELYVNSDVFTDLYAVSSSGESVLPLLEKYSVDLVIGDIEADNLAYRGLFHSPEWKIVFLNDRYFLAVTQEMVTKFNLEAITSIDPYSQTAAQPGQEQKAANYYQDLISQGYDTGNNRLYLARALQSMGKFEQANQVIDGIVIDPRSPLGPALLSDKNYLQADNFLNTGNCSRTQQSINLATSYSRSYLSSYLSFFNNSQPSAESIKVLALYNLVCLKDSKTAQIYLNQFLALKDTGPLEKAKIVKQFSDLSAGNPLQKP